MATNDKFTQLVKKYFQGDRGKEFQLLRKKIEVIEFTGTPNTNQQAWIDAVNTEYDAYVVEAKKLSNEDTLEDIV